MPIMPATLSQIRTDTRSHVDETSAQFWSNAELDRWINEALRDVARRTLNLQTEVSLNSVANKQEYEAPNDMIQIHRVAYRRSSTYELPLEYIDPARMDDYWLTNHTQTGTPAWWTMFGWPGSAAQGQIRLFPVPDSSIDSAIRIWYYRFPVALTNEDQPAEIPNGWHDLIPLYVEIVARRKDNDARWKEAQELYEARLQNLYHVTRHWSDQETYMSDARSMFPAYYGDWGY